MKIQIAQIIVQIIYCSLFGVLATQMGYEWYLGTLFAVVIASIIGISIIRNATTLPAANLLTGTNALDDTRIRNSINVEQVTSNHIDGSDEVPTTFNYWMTVLSQLLFSKSAYVYIITSVIVLTYLILFVLM